MIWRTTDDALIAIVIPGAGQKAFAVGFDIEILEGMEPMFGFSRG
jgi:hypothetical protein